MNVYRVLITNLLNSRVFDHYLVKVEPEELSTIEKRIHENYPNKHLKVKFSYGEGVNK